jgi:hypothetical protein
MVELLCKSSVGLGKVQTCKAEPFASSLKLFDCMAAEVPIIATGIGNIG